MANLHHEDDHEFGRIYHVTSFAEPTLKRKPRMHTVALSDCVCYDADGNVTKVIPRKSATVSRNRTPRKSTVVTSRARRDIMLQSLMSSNHEGDV